MSVFEYAAEAEESNPAGEHTGDNFVHVDFHCIPPYLQQFADAVVLVEATQANGNIMKGTGFLLQRPPISINRADLGENSLISWQALGGCPFVILTNAHVVGNAIALNIRVVFFYDTPRAPNDSTVECRVSRIIWYSPPTGSAGIALQDQLDFAALEFHLPIAREDSARICNVQPLRWEESRLDAAVDPALVNTLPMNVKVGGRMKMLMIGHPRGSYKRVSYGSMPTRPEQPYATTSTMVHTVASRPGSSGSPIFIFAAWSQDNRAFTKWVALFHYWSHRGIIFGAGPDSTGIGSKIREQINLHTYKVNSKAEFNDVITMHQSV